MVREEILEGLRASVIRGEPLRKAMMTFYNAGYKKQEIEEAARALNALPAQQRMPGPVQKSMQQVASFQPSTEEQPKKPQAIQPPQSALIQQTRIQPTQQQSQIPAPVTQQIPAQVDPRFQQPVIIQRVSGYGQKPSPLGLIVTFVLVFFLLFLMGILVAVFLFKDELSTIFSGFF